MQNNQTNTSRKYYWYTNGEENVKLKSLDNIPEGFYPGRSGDPWNKNLTKDTNDILKYISKIVSEKTKGRTAPNKGIPVSEERKLKQSQKMKQNYAEGLVVWNKGLTKETSESVASASKKMLGHIPHTSEEAVQKMLNSKRINKTFNTSKIEERMFENLKIQNPGKRVLRQYRDKERYPFCCDFYIVEDDLFIELNAHWTHGGRPFDPNDESCQKQLEDWKLKAQTSDYYNYAIHVWTVSDVLKRSYAEKFGLNYEAIYRNTLII